MGTITENLAAARRSAERARDDPELRAEPRFDVTPFGVGRDAQERPGAVAGVDHAAPADQLEARRLGCAHRDSAGTARGAEVSHGREALEGDVTPALAQRLDHAGRAALAREHVSREEPKQAAVAVERAAERPEGAELRVRVHAADQRAHGRQARVPLNDLP